MNKKLIKFKSQRLAEIFQSLDIKFSFVTKDGDTYTQIHDVVKCRDFLGDCIWSKKTGNKSNIYWFSYNYKTNPFDEKKLRLSLTFPNQDSMTNFQNNFHILNEKEKLTKTTKSKYYLTDDKMSIILESDKVWQSATWKIGLFTFYLKLISYKDITKPQDPEDTYLKKLTPEREAKFLAKVKYEKEHLFDNIYEAHNYTGFVSIITGYNKVMNKFIFGTT